MRLMEREKKPHYRRCAETTGRDAYREPIVEWGPPELIRAARQPVTGSVSAQLYGQQIARMMTLIYEAPAILAEGDRLCVCVGPTDDPDYKVVSALPWDGHRKAEIEWIPPEKRKAGAAHE